MRSSWCAIVFAAAVLALPCAAQEQVSPAAGYPGGQGVFYRAPSGWVQVPLGGVLWLNTEDQWKWHLAVGDENYEVSLAGEHAAMQVPNGKPTFLLQGLYPPPGSTMVRLEIEENKREVEADPPGGWQDGLKFDRKDVVQVEITRLGNRRFLVTPVQPLPAGEYVMLLAGIEGQRWIRIGAPFGVPPAASANTPRR